MISKSTILSMISVLCCITVFAQTAIDYQPKALLKTLQKAGITDVSYISEFSIPDSTSLQAKNGKFFRIEKDNNSPFKYIYVGRVISCRAGGCSINQNVTTDGNSEYFDYYMLFDNHKTIRAVKVYNYQATHGQEVTAKGWLKQFVGFNGSVPLEVNKNIDAISGATISVYAITTDVEMKTTMLVKLK